MAVYGVAFTSEPYEDTRHNDQFFYVDEAGNRKPVKDGCAYISGNGGLAGDDDKDGIGVSYDVLYVSNSKCNDNSDSFDESEKHQIQRHEILKEWREVFIND
jgi:hypothetical protein